MSISFKLDLRWTTHETDFLHRLAVLLTGDAFVIDLWAKNGHRNGPRYGLGYDKMWRLAQDGDKWTLTLDGADRLKMRHLRHSIIWLLGIEKENLRKKSVDVTNGVETVTTA